MACQFVPLRGICGFAVIIGGALLIVVILAICILTCAYVKRKQRMSHNRTDNSTTISTGNNYRIESLHTNPRYYNMHYFQ